MNQLWHLCDEKTPAVVRLLLCNIFPMTKKKFISNYTERFWFYMLEWYSDSKAVEKVLGEVYDKVKRPKSSYTREDMMSILFWDKNYIRDTFDEYEAWQEVWFEKLAKYLFDSNGWDSSETVSDNTFRKCKRCMDITPRYKIHVCELSE